MSHSARRANKLRPFSSRVAINSGERAGVHCATAEEAQLDTREKRAAAAATTSAVISAKAKVTRAVLFSEETKGRRRSAARPQRKGRERDGNREKERDDDDRVGDILHSVSIISES